MTQFAAIQICPSVVKIAPARSKAFGAVVGAGGQQIGTPGLTDAVPGRRHQFERSMNVGHEPFGIGASKPEGAGEPDPREQPGPARRALFGCGRKADVADGQGVVTSTGVHPKHCEMFGH